MSGGSESDCQQLRLACRAGIGRAMPTIGNIWPMHALPLLTPDCQMRREGGNGGKGPPTWVVARTQFN